LAEFNVASQSTRGAAAAAAADEAQMLALPLLIRRSPHFDHTHHGMLSEPCARIE